MFTLIPDWNHWQDSVATQTPKLKISFLGTSQLA